MQHPDKGGDTEHFQKLTQAVREVMKYSLEHPELVKSTEDMESMPDKVLLKIFETKTKIDFNSGNVVVHIEDDMVSKWTKSFDDYFSLEKKKKVQDGFQYRMDDWKAPMSNMEPGSVTVTFYSQSQAGPKFMVQGTHGLSFVTMVLPEIAESLGKPEAEEEKEDNNETDSAEKTAEEAESAETSKDSTIPDETNKPDGTDKLDQTQTEVSNPNSDKDMFKRLQDNLITQLSTMNNTLTSSLEKQKQLETKVDDLKTEVKSLKEKVETSKEETKTKIDEVETRVLTAINDKKSVQIDFLKAGWKENKDKLKSMNDTVDNLMTRLNDMFSLVGRNTPFPGTLGSKQDEVVEVKKIKVRKGIIFTDSIGSEIDIERFEKTTSSKVEVIETNSVLQTEQNLEEMVNKHMNGEHNFAVVMVGTNDISDTKGKTKADQMKYCKDISSKLVDIAERKAHEHSADFFLSEMVPRYDCPKLEQSNQLCRSFLNVTAASAPTERIYVVGQAGLSCPAQGRRREELYSDQDNIHLTSKGLYNASTNIIYSIKEVYKDLKDLPVHAPKTPSTSNKKEAPQKKEPTHHAFTPDTSQPPPYYTKLGGTWGPSERPRQPPPHRGNHQSSRPPRLNQSKYKKKPYQKQEFQTPPYMERKEQQSGADEVEEQQTWADEVEDYNQDISGNVWRVQQPYQQHNWGRVGYW